MTNRSLMLDRGRRMVLANEDDVDIALQTSSERPIATLLTDKVAVNDPGRRSALLGRLLSAGCDYFVCFGPLSEQLHDAIDGLSEDRDNALTMPVMTTWHDDESAADVVHFFVNVAGARRNGMLLVILAPEDNEIREALRNLLRI